METSKYLLIEADTRVVVALFDNYKDAFSARMNDTRDLEIAELPAELQK